MNQGGHENLTTNAQRKVTIEHGNTRHNPLWFGKTTNGLIYYFDNEKEKNALETIKIRRNITLNS